MFKMTLIGTKNDITILLNSFHISINIRRLILCDGASMSPDPLLGMAWNKRKWLACLHVDVPQKCDQRSICVILVWCPDEFNIHVVLIL